MDKALSLFLAFIILLQTLLLCGCSGAASVVVSCETIINESYVQIRVTVRNTGFPQTYGPTRFSFATLISGEGTTFVSNEDDSIITSATKRIMWVGDIASYTYEFDLLPSGEYDLTFRFLGELIRIEDALVVT